MGDELAAARQEGEGCIRKAVSVLGLHITLPRSEPPSEQPTTSVILVPLSRDLSHIVLLFHQRLLFSRHHPFAGPQSKRGRGAKDDMVINWVQRTHIRVG